jgi:hypothetical protein
MAWIATVAALGAAAVGVTPARADVVDDEPAAVALASGDLALFARGDDNALWQRSLGAAGWTDWSSLEGTLGSGPRALTYDSSLQVFARGSGGQLLQRWRTGDQWSAWQTLDGVLLSAPGLSVRRGLDYLDVVVRGTDNAVDFRSYVPGGGWSAWSSLGGATYLAPAVVSYRSGFVHVFATGTDGALAVRYWDGSAWSGWSSLGGVATSGPAVVSDGDSRIDAFVRGSDAAIHRIYWRDATGWSPWARVDPTPVSSGPAAVALGPDHYALFARLGADIVVGVLNNGAWSGWKPVQTTPPPPAPSACGHSVAVVKSTLRGKHRRTVDYGHGATIVGAALGPDRQPVAGALVHVLDMRAHADIGQVAAGADGTFRFKVPAGTSRTLRAAFQWGTEGFYACGRSLSLKVRAAVRLQASRHVRVRGRIRMSGRLLGDHIPPRGKLVELQGWARGAWQLFRQVRTRRSGRFSATYRLRTGARGTLKIRARVRAERGYPYTLGWSRVVRVRVG